MCVACGGKHYGLTIGITGSLGSDGLLSFVKVVDRLFFCQSERKVSRNFTNRFVSKTLEWPFLVVAKFL